MSFLFSFFNPNASKPSEHPPGRGGDVKTFGNVCALFSFCLFLFFVFFYSLEMSFFPSSVNVISLYGEYVVRFFLPDGVFLSCDHGLDFLYQLNRM